MITTRSIDIFLKGIKNRSMTRRKPLAYKPGIRTNISRIKPLRIKPIKMKSIRGIAVKSFRTQNIKMPKIKIK